MTRGCRKAMPRVTAGLLVALQWCSRCRVHGRGYDLRPPWAPESAATAAEVTSPAQNIPRRRPHLRHPRSAAPERPGGSPAAAAASTLGGDGGNVSGGFGQRRSLSENLEAYVESTEACASRMEYTLSQCDFQNRQTLEWSYGEGDSASDCETPLPEGGSLKCDHVEWNSGEGIAIGVLAGVGVAVSLCFWLALSRYKQSRVVRLGQPASCKTFVVGIGVTFLSILALLGATTDITCALRLWGYSAGFDLAFCALTLKMRNACGAAETSMKQAYSMRLSRRMVLLVLLLDVAGDVAVLSRWTASFGDDCGVEYESVGGGAFIRRNSCMACSNLLLWAWIALKAVLVLFCCYVSFQARKFQDCMRDNGGIGMATYNLVVAGLLVAAVVWAEANAQVCRTTEGVAILLAGVGVLFPVLGTRVLRAKQELEGKALVGPSAAAAAAAAGSGTGILVGDALYGVGERIMDGDEYPEPRTTTPSGVSSVGGAAADGVGTGGGGSGRRRRPVSREVVGGARGSGTANYAQGLVLDADYDGRPQSIPSPLPPKEAAAFATATAAAAEAAAAAAAALEEGNDSGGSCAAGKQCRTRRRVQDQPRPKAPPAASVICARPNPAAGGGGAVGAVGGGSFATTGGATAAAAKAAGEGRSSLGEDQSAFWTPPRKDRRARSSVEMITRSADAMVLAAAAAGRANGTGGGGDGRGASRAAGRSASSVSSHRRKSSGASGGSGGGGVGGGGRRQPAQGTSSAAMLKGIRGGDSHRGGGGGGKGTMSVASGSSRASSRGRSAHSHSLSHYSASKTSHRSSGTTNRQCASTTSGGSPCGETNSARSSRDSWAFDPIIMAINGYGWGAGGGSKQITAGGGAGLGGSGRKQRNTSFSGSAGGGGGGGGQRGSGRWPSGVRKRRKSKERAASVAGSAGGETRSSGVKSLVMFAEYGTRLHCPHCSKEVAGCGFRGCSGSLIRKPSFSDEFGPEESFSLPVPQPVRAPAFGGFSSAMPGGGGGAVVGSSLSAAVAGGGGDEMVPSGGGNNNMLSPSTQNCGSVRSASHRTTSGEGGGGGGGGTGGGAHKSLPMAAASRLRMSFRRGPSPCDTFDNESDCDDDDDDDEDDDFDDYDDYESQRSNFGMNSPTSSYAWG